MKRVESMSYHERINYMRYQLHLGQNAQKQQREVFILGKPRSGSVTSLDRSMDGDQKGETATPATDGDLG